MQNAQGKRQQPGESERVVRVTDNVVSSRDLLGACKKVLIAHDAGTYELRVTRQGKLILTK